MTRLTTLLILMLTSCVLWACEPSKKATAKTPDAAPVEQSIASPSSASDEQAGGVEVSTEGTTFKPAITVAQVPEGAYYCDMGTVHYARNEQGDGKCTLCGMALKHKMSKDAPPSHEESDHSGHED